MLVTKINAEEFADALNFANKVHTVVFADIDGTLFLAPFKYKWNSYKDKARALFTEAEIGELFS